MYVCAQVGWSARLIHHDDHLLSLDGSFVNSIVLQRGTAAGRTPDNSLTYGVDSSAVDRCVMLSAPCVMVMATLLPPFVMSAIVCGFDVCCYLSTTGAYAYGEKDRIVLETKLISPNFTGTAAP